MKKLKMCMQTIRALAGALNVSLQFMRWQRTMMTCAYVAHTHPRSYNPDTNIDGIIECFIECRESLTESVSVLEDSLAGLEESLYTECKDVLLLANHVVSSDNLLLDQFLISAGTEPTLISDELIIKDMLTPSDVSAYRTVRGPLSDIVTQYSLLRPPTSQPALTDLSKMSLAELAQRAHGAFSDLLHDLKAYAADYDVVNNNAETLLTQVCCLPRSELAALTAALRDRFSEMYTELPAPVDSNDNMAICLRKLIVLASQLVCSDSPFLKDHDVARLRAVLERILTIEDTNKTILLALEPLLSE